MGLRHPVSCIQKIFFFHTKIIFAYVHVSHIYKCICIWHTNTFTYIYVSYIQIYLYLAMPEYTCICARIEPPPLPPSLSYTHTDVHGRILPSASQIHWWWAGVSVLIFHFLLFLCSITLSVYSILCGTF